MIYNYIILSFFFLLSALPGLAQQVNPESIKASPDYYWGESTQRSAQEASDKALSKLIAGIAVKVQSSFERTVNETSESFEETVNDVLQTYTSATLKNVGKYAEPRGDGFYVFHFIKKKDVQKIFDTRKRLVADMYDHGLQSEATHNIAAALKNYYFAIILMNSLPEQNIDHMGKNLVTEIPNRINSILTRVRMTCTSDKLLNEREREVRLEVMDGEFPAIMLDFTYWDGSNQMRVTAVDGEAVVRLIGPSTAFDDLDIRIKYDYYEQRDEFKEVSELWGMVVTPEFMNNMSVNLPGPETAGTESATPSEQQTASGENTSTNTEGAATTGESTASGETVEVGRTLSFNIDGITFRLKNNEECTSAREIARQTAEVLNLLQDNNKAAVRSYFADDSFLSEKITSMMNYNKLSLIDRKVHASINKTFEGWELRKVRVHTFYSSMHKQTTEYLIFDFDESGGIYDVSFGIIDGLYNQFVEMGMYGEDWKRRQVIIKFMERYRTAFLVRDIDMLDKMFAEEAVIIVGRVLRKGEQRKNYEYQRLTLDQPSVEYMEYNKQEYLRRQEAVFRQHRDIFVGYSQFKINRKNDREGVYGVSMRQNYQATTYADEGYLFLLVDFNEELPQIYVRSWQPQEWSEAALIELSNFRVND